MRIRIPTAVSTLSIVLLLAAPAQSQADNEGQAPPPEDGTESNDDSAEAEGPSPSRPAPRGKGAVWGVVTDTKFAEPLPEAQVTVVGKGIQTLTDIDGRYRLELPPGVYTLRIWYEMHQPTRLEGVRVFFGKVSQLDAKLPPMEGAEDVVEVETEADTESIEGQTLVRKRATVVGDAVGRAEIAKTPDKNAAEAAKRVVGATIVGSRFVFVRGLGERYTNSLLDGSPLPSPEPDRQTVPLDLFPSLMLDGLNIAKTFTPDFPGDFAGGSVRIRLRRLPKKFFFQASLSAGFNTQSTFRQRLTYPGSATDWLGFDDGTRALPESIPDYKIYRGAKHPDGQFLTKEQLTTYGRAINGPMSTQRALTPPNHGGNVVVGHTFDLGKGHRLGALAALTYSRKYVIRQDEEIRTFRLERYSDSGLAALNDLKVERGIDKVRWGALGSVTYEPSKKHRFHLTGLYSRTSDNEASEIEGHHEERGSKLHETRLNFVGRGLAFGQLRGEHEMDEMADGEIDWHLSLSLATRDDPNTRSTVWELDSQFGYAYEDDSQSGLHFYSEQSERTFVGGLNWLQPVAKGDVPTNLKWGGLVSLRAREFDARRFRYRPISGASPAALVCSGQSWSAHCPDQVFADGNIGTVLEVEESTRPNDAYTADLNVYSGYLMADVGLHKTLRLVAGQRLEVSLQNIDSYDPFNPDVGRINTELTSEDMLPAVALLWNSTDKSNLRFSFTRTLARPQLRELAPFSFTDFFGGREVQGNPDLQYTHITNVDLRYEFFPTLREVLAFTLFYKKFEDPIEQIIRSAGARGIVTYQNADGADLLGVELEGRKNLEFITSALKDFTFLSNFTFARSQVHLDEQDAVFVTSMSRPMSHQAPFIVNVSLDFNREEWGTRARLLYNVSGRRLVQVGTQGLPDVYQQPRHQLDFTAAQRIIKGLDLKFSATNLINDDVVRTQGKENRDDTVVHRYWTGASFSIGASYKY